MFSKILSLLIILALTATSVSAGFGKMTWYGADGDGPDSQFGSCGYSPSSINSQNFAALNVAEMGSNGKCNWWATVTYKGRSVDVRIVDTLPSRGDGIDLSRPAFAALLGGTAADASRVGVIQASYTVCKQKGCGSGSSNPVEVKKSTPKATTKTTSTPKPTTKSTPKPTPKPTTKATTKAQTTTKAEAKPTTEAKPEAQQQVAPVVEQPTATTSAQTTLTARTRASSSVSGTPTVLSIKDGRFVYGNVFNGTLARGYFYENNTITNNHTLVSGHVVNNTLVDVTIYETVPLDETLNIAETEEAATSTTEATEATSA